MRFAVKVQSRPTALLDPPIMCVATFKLAVKVEGLKTFCVPQEEYPIARREQECTAEEGNGGLREGYGSHLVRVSKK